MSLCAYVEQITMILVSKINLWQIPLMLTYNYVTLKKSLLGEWVMCLLFSINMKKLFISINHAKFFALGFLQSYKIKN